MMVFMILNARNVKIHSIYSAIISNDNSYDINKFNHIPDDFNIFKSVIKKTDCVCKID